MNRLEKMTLTLVAGIMMTAGPALLAQQETSPDQFLPAVENSAPVVQKAKMEDSKGKVQKQKPSAAHKNNRQQKVLVAKK
jgi:hypothetical protein